MRKINSRAAPNWALYPTMTETLPTSKKAMAPTSRNCGAGTPADSMTFATSLKWGILLPTAASKKIVQSRRRPRTVSGPRSAWNMVLLLMPGQRTELRMERRLEQLSSPPPCLPPIVQTQTVDISSTSARKRPLISLVAKGLPDLFQEPNEFLQLGLGEMA